ncbi:MAG: DUF1365 domain-containing protein [Thiobacillus sp.]|nr:DUF1365 domain-containing protein [Thiobacillus sp.]
MHARLHPALHRFDYPVYFLRLPIHALENAETRWLSLNRFNLLSFHEADHGDGGNCLDWVHELLIQHGLVANGEIWLTTFPRVLGYAFKPVSFWHCHAADGSLVAVLAEVNNTFGEHHVYLLRTSDPDAILHADKVFHVSPFFPVRGQYSFRFQSAADFFRARIDYDDGSGDALRTAWFGRLEPLTARACLRAFFAYPLMTWGVIVRIHLQALRLFAKRVPFFRKPPTPLDEVTE